MCKFLCSYLYFDVKASIEIRLMTSIHLCDWSIQVRIAGREDNAKSNILAFLLEEKCKTKK